jgi:uncharacterized protein YndB with AHSA1/START domain
MIFEKKPVAKAQMLIHKPVSEVFESFIDPAVTTHFWFTHSSGRLEPGKQVQWTWDMYHFSTQVLVKQIEINQRILIEWSAYGQPTIVEWLFIPLTDQSTLVTIKNEGFSGTGDEMVQQAIDSTEGFAIVLAGLKAFLEYNLNLNLISDHSPNR